MRQIFLLAVLALGLSACATKTDTRNSDPAKWGNYKCVTQAGNRSFQGWSTNKSDAKRNSMAICEERATDCRFVSCND